MHSATVPDRKSDLKFPPFDLGRLIKTTLNPQRGEKICILIDLKNPKEVINFAFLKNDKWTVQKKAYDIFYKGIKDGLMEELGLSACDFFAYEATGGSNLELPYTVFSPEGKKLNLENDIYRIYDIILFITNFSATAPATAASKEFGFRGATMHGMNDIILNSGLAVDYNQVSQEAEKLRQGMTNSDSAEIDFEVDNKTYHLHIDLGRQNAQKSHGICHDAPDIANLPAGEVYFVPMNAVGEFPIKFEEDGKTLGLMHVKNCRVDKISFIKGNQNLVDELQKKLDTDPATGILGELGFGTQVLPYAGSDIQDEKIFGTFHLATGRNDHLNGNVTKNRFNFLHNASHDDILFSLNKTPEITVKKVVLNRQGKPITIIENYEPTEYLLNLKYSTSKKS
jgi:aminopeptidase